MEPAFSNDAYVAYKPPASARRLKVSLRFKPNNTNDGVLLYCAESEEGHGDFISVAIKDRHLEFRFNSGSGPAVVRSQKEIRPGEWSTLTASKSFTEGRLVIDAGPPSVTRLSGNHKTLNLQTPLYVGGYDKHKVKLNQEVDVFNGFNGCISNVTISGKDLHILHNATDSSNVENCNPEDDVDNNIYSPEYAHQPPVRPTAYDSRIPACSNSPCQNHGMCYPVTAYDYQCQCLPGFMGKNCETTKDICNRRPCQNGGICKTNETNYNCECPLGFIGDNCEQKSELRNDAHFNGNGYLEFARSFLSHDNDDETEIIALEFSTNKSDGLIFWHGQPPNVNGEGQDYISLALSNGYLEFSFDLGMGPALIENNHLRVDDGERHSVILKRQGRKGSIEIGHLYVMDGEADGTTNSMNCAGNIYLGGTPNVRLMTGGRFTKGFDGCIHGFELQQSKTLDLGVKAISGLNVKPCSSFLDNSNSIWDEGLIN